MPEQTAGTMPSVYSTACKSGPLFVVTNNGILGNIRTPE